MSKESCWKIVYDNFESAEESLREALCTLGNGYVGTRGVASEAIASNVHYPGTYIAGLYNRLTTNIAGRKIVNEDFVNCPNWTFLTFKIKGDKWFLPSATRIVSYRQELDMQRGILKRRMRIRNRKGQITLVESERLVHMMHPHYAAIKYVITPQNYSGWITVRSMLDGTVRNAGVERYKQLESKHLKLSALGRFAHNGVYLSMKTTQSQVEIGQAAKIRLFTGGKERKPNIFLVTKDREAIGHEFKFFARRSTSYEIEKIVSIYTSKDEGITDPIVEAINSIKKIHRFNTLLKTHQLAWAKLWDKFDISIHTDSFSQTALRLHMFHLLQTASPNNVNIDAGFPARGLHGESYRGHIFWDKMFTMYFYDLHAPEISRALLLYRYRRLDKAREYAKKNGHKGAMFPWQSASTGEEETQIVHLNPLSGKWGPDHSRLQRHVSFSIAYSVWYYYRRTSDWEFMVKFGAELIISIAQFAASFTYYDFKDKRYHTRGIMGPDEFHEKYPKSLRAGLRDNAYSNLMIAWILLKAKEIINRLSKDDKKRIMKKVHFDERGLKEWDRIIRKMNIIINKEGIISQFDGYFKLKELDWAGYKAMYGNIHRMDRILKAEGKSPDDYKVTKQADVLMMFYLFPFSQIRDIFKMLGYSLDVGLIRKNYDYYLRRTSHGSTLSKVVHCLVALRLNKHKRAWHWFKDILESDMYDVQGGTTPEGIHAGVMAGSVDIVMRGFAGVTVLPDRIRISPWLPQCWRSLKFKLLFKARWISFSITKKTVTIIISGSRKKPFPLCFEIKRRLYDLSNKVKLVASYK